MALLVPTAWRLLWTTRLSSSRSLTARNSARSISRLIEVFRIGVCAPTLGESVPDGICIDADGAVWYADVPNKRCVRVREGGEVLQTIKVDRGCFACMLGGLDKKTLFIMAAEWHGFAKMMDGLGTGQVLTVEAPAPGVGWP
jgi:sugar lactone lactonase YvrE